MLKRVATKKNLRRRGTSLTKITCALCGLLRGNNIPLIPHM